MPKIIHLQRYTPNPNGSGGQHRLYQIHQNLIELFGSSNIDSLTLGEIRNYKQNLLNYYLKRFSERFYFLSYFLRRAIRNRCDPKLLQRDLINRNIKTSNPFGQIKIADYIRYIEINGKPDVCVADYPSFLELTYFNNANGIATIYCPQNIESLTKVTHKVDDNSARVQCALHWLTELEMYNICQERLMISLSEMSFVRGLGLSTYYYPYIPVNDIYSRLISVRQNRTIDSIEPGLFLMVGSIHHRPTNEGFRWLLGNMKEKGIPDGIHIIVGGRGGNSLRDEFKSVKGLEIKDILEQDELNRLMIKACAVLIPQRSGFGAVTRIPETACAGIPAIASEHTKIATELPPGVKVVNDDWHAWLSAMQHFRNYPISNTLIEYKAWEEKQPNPIEEVFERYLDNNKFGHKYGKKMS